MLIDIPKNISKDIPSTEEILENISHYTELKDLLDISDSQAHRIYSGVSNISLNKRELLSFKLGIHPSHMLIVKKANHLLEYHEGNDELILRIGNDEQNPTSVRSKAIVAAKEEFFDRNESFNFGSRRKLALSLMKIGV